MKIVVSGATGMLGCDMTQELVRRGHDVVALDHRELDVTDIRAVRECIAGLRPHVAVNCAAYTRVDDAEAEKALAFATNALGPRNLALACREAKAALLQVSTDYVFDGKKAEPYTIWDTPSPLNAYGASKLWGENYVRSLLAEHYLVRTSWLFGQHGRNFVDTMLKMGGDRSNSLYTGNASFTSAGVRRDASCFGPERHGNPRVGGGHLAGSSAIPVVADQCSSPTYTVDLAKACADLLETGCFGIYHVTNQGVTTWYEFAKAIFERAGLAIDVRPTTSEEFRRSAARPRNSALDPYPLRETIGYLLPSWEDALERYLSQVGSLRHRVDRRRTLAPD
ncbi:MAG: SDR family oxidoreductase [Bacillota bacterium]